MVSNCAAVLEVDVYFVLPNGLRLWTAPTKGYQLFRGEGAGRVPVERRLATLTSSNKSFTGTFYVEGVSTIICTVDLHAMPTTGNDGVVGAKVTAINFGLQPYTPQTAPFQRLPDNNWPIAERLWKENGVGMRRNGDRDNGSSVTRDWFISNRIENENDLIRVDIQVEPVIAGIKYVLKKSETHTVMWSSSRKGGSPYGVPTTGTEIISSGTLWAEYTKFGNAPCTFTLAVIDRKTNRELFTEEMVFKPFNSVVIVTLGNRQNPADPIANPTHALGQWAIDLYREGIYDVHLYSNRAVAGSNSGGNMGSGTAYNEIVSAINDRGVTNVALVGYSYGGGAVYGLSRRLNRNTLPEDDPQRLTDITKSFALPFAGYIDAIQNRSWGAYAQNQAPHNATKFYNRFQTNDRDHYTDYSFPIFGQAFGEAYNTNQNCNAESVADPETGIMRLVDHYIIDELVIQDDLTEEFKGFVGR